MKLNNIEKDFLVEFLKGEAKKQIWEDVTITNICHAMILRHHPGKQSWEIEGFPSMCARIKPIIKKHYINRRKVAKQILKKIRSSKLKRNGGKK